MKRTQSILLVLLLFQAAYAQHQHGAPEKLGTVSFPVSCAAKVQSSFNRAVALLHSFAYAPATAAFQEIARQEPPLRHGPLGRRHELLQPALVAATAGRRGCQRPRRVGASATRDLSCCLSCPGIKYLYTFLRGRYAYL